MANPEEVKKKVSGLIKWAHWVDKDIRRLMGLVEGQEDPDRPPPPPDFNGDDGGEGGGGPS